MPQFKKRRHRTEYRSDIYVLSEEDRFGPYNSRNISLNGVLIETTARLPLKETCQIEISLHGADLTLLINARVVRLDEDMAAFTFESMDLDTFTHLKNIVLYNTPEPDEFLKQCEENPGFKLPE